MPEEDSVPVKSRKKDVFRVAVDSKPKIPHGLFDPECKDGIWHGLVKIEKLTFPTGKIVYHISIWDHTPGPGPRYSWKAKRRCRWFIPAFVYAHLNYRKLFKERAQHGEPKIQDIMK